MDGRVCPYCQFPIRGGEDVIVCPSCETAHHKDCWLENGGCARYGCPSSPEATEAPLVVNLSGEGRDFCHHCLRSVPSGSRVCPWCGRRLRPPDLRGWWERSPLATLGAVVLSILLALGFILLMVCFFTAP